MKTNLIKKTSIAALLCLASTSVLAAGGDHKDDHHGDSHAGGISYDFFDIAYIDADAEGETGDGFLLRGTKSIGESFYGLFEYADTDLDDEGDVSFGRIGLGYHTPLTSAVDGIAEVTYEQLEINEHGHEFDESGYGLALGARALFTEKLEATARVRYVDLGEEDDVIAGVELLYLFNHSFGVVAAYETGNEDFASVGVRFQF